MQGSASSSFSSSSRFQGSRLAVVSSCHWINAGLLVLRIASERSDGGILQGGRYNRNVSRVGILATTDFKIDGHLPKGFQSLLNQQFAKAAIRQTTTSLNVIP